MTEPYAVNKLVSHPEVLEDLRSGGPGRLISVHLMPQNVCNHSCSFCSYRLEGNKNSEVFDDEKALPEAALKSLLSDFAELGVQGVEVTGGGEPLVYPHFETLWGGLAQHGFATALVTNGSMMREDKAERICSTRLKWARISIDAGKESTYTQIRKCPPSHFFRAWDAVRFLRLHAPRDPEFCLGVGFVLSNENIGEILEFAKRARDAGADNVRLSACYSDQHLAYYRDEKALRRAVEDSRKAEELATPSFKVVNLIPKRVSEIEAPQQDYPRCVTQELLCVVEGEGRVYTCCTFTGSLKGLQGNILQHPEGFKGIWRDRLSWRRELDPRHYCRCSCLYRDRNLAMLDLLAEPKQSPAGDHIHKEFI